MTTSRRATFLSLVLFSFSYQCLAGNWPVPAHSWGGSSTDASYSVAVDSSGDVYVAGYTESFGAGGQDVLITKYGPSGGFLWAKTWGGSGDEFASSIKVGPDGLIYVAGYTSSFGAGWYDLFLLKLDTGGNLIWGTTWGGSSFDGGHDIAFDANGNIYVVGESYSTSPCCTAVLLKFSTGGSLLQETYYKGPATYDTGYSVTVDSNFNVIVAGISWDYSIPPLHNSILLLKFGPTGNLTWQKNWSTPFPGQDESTAFHSLATDSAGNIYVGGRHSANCQTTNFSLCDFDAMLLKLDTNGNFQWSKAWGAVGTYDTVGSVALDSSGHVLAAGMENEFGVPLLSVLSYDTNGNLLSQTGWSQGTIQQGSTPGMVLDASNNAYVASAALNNTGVWAATSATAGSLPNSLVTNTYSVGTASLPISALTNPMVLQAGTKDTGGGGSDLFVAQYQANTALGPSLLFPVKNNYQCGSGACTPSNAPITSVFDHSTAGPYCKGAGGYGAVTAFTGELGLDPVTTEAFGCESTTPLYGYSNPGISQFLRGYNYQPPKGVLYYDGHPGYDYSFGYTTPLYPAISGCVTYFQDAAGEAAARGHVLAIIPQPTRLAGGCQNALKNPQYSIVYMHLSSYYDSDNQQVMRCTSFDPVTHDCAEEAPCPACAQQGEWVSTDRANPIGYPGNFLVTAQHPDGWGGVPVHLHFEVDKIINKIPKALDPYGWCASAGADPYTSFTGLVNVTLWSPNQFALTCPSGG